MQEKARRLAGFFVAGQGVPNGIAFVVMAASLRPYWIWPPPRRITPSMFRQPEIGRRGKRLYPMGNPVWRPPTSGQRIPGYAPLRGL